MKSARKLPLKDAWVIWFLLGVVMINYPFLHIFNKEMLVFGIPLTVLYFYIGWPASIFVIYLFSIYLVRHSPDHDAPKKHQDKDSHGETS